MICGKGSSGNNKGVYDVGRIIILDEDTSNMIAAGEVIERPASAVKELVENSIDADAHSIKIEIGKGGVQYIKITDNGYGILEDDARIAFERHSTSKIKSSANLNNIKTLGFRGEALASVASVSKIQLMTKARGCDYGILLALEGGREIKYEKCGCQEGTSITVSELFFNTPARYKFLKQDSTEARYITDIITRIALGNTAVAFDYTNSGTTAVRTPGNSDLLSTIYSIYGKDTASGCIPVSGENSYAKISGYIGKPENARANRANQSFYVNGRYVKNQTVTAALEEAFKTYLMKNKYPFAVLNISIVPELVDVNVHPTKMQIKFSDEQEIFRLIYHSVMNALTGEKQQLSDVSEEAKDLVQYGTQGTRDTVQYRVHAVDHTKNNFTRVDYSIFDFSLPDPAAQVINENTGAGRINIHKLSDAKLAGQLFSTFILMESGDLIVAIDQHAAHERIMYERIKKKYLSGEVFAQQQLDPPIVELSHKETEIVRENEAFLKSAGYEIEYFGSGSILLRSIPYMQPETNIKQTFLEILDYLVNNENMDTNKILDETLYKIACSAAIKANMVLAEQEIRNLIRDLAETENPYNCPHGRPTMIIIEKAEIEKRFKRIL